VPFAGVEISEQLLLAIDALKEAAAVAILCWLYRDAP
jgi:hypothetical protein